ncbi:MAG: class I SAM-dependent methyltransferase [Bacteroidota bacterium]
MTPLETAQSYDQIADLWVSDDFDRTNGIAQHERALAFLPPDHGRRALDIGCGSSTRILELLLSHGFEVEGLDISPRMLELASAQHPEVVFHHADICEWTFPYPYDVISAWDSLWHLPLDQQESVLQKTLSHLAPGGVFITTTAGLDVPKEITNADMGVEVSYSTLGLPHLLRLLTDSGCVCRHLEYDQYPELHVVVIAQKSL